jgi:glycosyltransferase involved in cell wall biosynthesis
LAAGTPLPGTAQRDVRHIPGVQIVPLKTVFFGKKPYGYFMKGLLSLVARQPYQVMITSSNPRDFSYLLSLLYAKLKGVRTILWGHGISSHSNRYTLWVLLKLAAFADALIFYDSLHAEQYIDMGVPRAKVFVAPNTIDVEGIFGLTRAWDADRNRILCIGRLIPAKKATLLIRGFAMASPSLAPKTLLTIIGDGPERPLCEALADQLGIRDKVVFTGAIYNDADLAPFFNAAWVSVCPGYAGLNVMHSLAFGVPLLVARDDPHSPEVVCVKEGYNTRFFPSNDPQALADQLIYCFQNPAEMARLARGAQETVRHKFSIAGMVKAFEDAVEFVLNR